MVNRRISMFGADLARVIWSMMWWNVREYIRIYHFSMVQSKGLLKVYRISNWCHPAAACRLNARRRAVLAQFAHELT